MLLSKSLSGQRRLFLVVLTVSSLLSICPEFYFRERYFVLLLPCAALLAMGNRGQSNLCTFYQK
ncbi:hypothetical protein JXQ70_09160 [bacterium]|nr:hypothetical protein [bacterium]